MFNKMSLLSCYTSFYADDYFEKAVAQFTVMAQSNLAAVFDLIATSSNTFVNIYGVSEKNSGTFASKENLFSKNDSS